MPPPAHPARPPTPPRSRRPSSRSSSLQPQPLPLHRAQQTAGSGYTTLTFVGTSTSYAQYPTHDATPLPQLPVSQRLPPTTQPPMPPSSAPGHTQGKRSFSAPLLARLRLPSPSSSAHIPSSSAGPCSAGGQLSASPVSCADRSLPPTSTVPFPAQGQGRMSPSPTSAGFGHVGQRVASVPAGFRYQDQPLGLRLAGRERERAQRLERGERVEHPEREREGKDLGERVGGRMISTVRRTLSALRRPSPAPEVKAEDYESALTAMRYGPLLSSPTPPPTIEQIARGLASKPPRPPRRFGPGRSSMKRPGSAGSQGVGSPALSSSGSSGGGTYSSPPTSVGSLGSAGGGSRGGTPSSSTSFLPSFGLGLSSLGRRLSRSSSATAGTETTAVDPSLTFSLGGSQGGPGRKGSGGSVSDDGHASFGSSAGSFGGGGGVGGRKAVRFGERVVVVGASGLRMMRGARMDE